MIDNNKNYWFCFEFYVYVEIKRNGILIYNTLDGNYIKSNDPLIISLIKPIYDDNNCGVIKILSDDLKKDTIFHFFNNIRDLYMGDMYDISLSTGKPIQLYPLFDSQKFNRKSDDLQARINGKNIIENLYKIDIYLNIDNHFTFVNNAKNKIESNGIKNLELNELEVLMKEIILEQKCCLNFIADNIYLYPDLDGFISLIKKYPLEKYITLPVDNLRIDVLMLLFKHFNINILISNPLSNNILSDVKKMKGFDKLKFLFKIRNLEEYDSSIRLIDSLSLGNTELVPVYDDNIGFLRNEVFWDEDDIFTKTRKMDEIFMNKVLNIYNFGKLTILPNSDVYANLNSPKLGNLKCNSIQELIYLELNNGESWLRVRNKEPCSECIYQWFCPSPSDLELQIGRSDLCNIKGIVFNIKKNKT